MKSFRIVYWQFDGSLSFVASWVSWSINLCIYSIHTGLFLKHKSLLLPKIPIFISYLPRRDLVTIFLSITILPKMQWLQFEMSRKMLYLRCYWLLYHDSRISIFNFLFSHNRSTILNPQVISLSHFWLSKNQEHR